MPIISQIQAKIKNYFVPAVLADLPSKINGRVVVKQVYGGSPYIHTGDAYVEQSGNFLNIVWKPVFKKIAVNHKSWLILGLAGGSLAKTISQKYFPTRIVGIEIDPVMIKVAKKYFDLDKIPNLKIINQDAQLAINQLTTNFDYVLVDMYLGSQLPVFVHSQKFISSVKKIGRVVVFNHLFYNDSNKKQAMDLLEILRKNFTSVKPVRSLANLLIICR